MKTTQYLIAEVPCRQLALMYLLGAHDRGKSIDALGQFKLPCSFRYIAMEDQTLERAAFLRRRR